MTLLRFEKFLISYLMNYIFSHLTIVSDVPKYCTARTESSLRIASFILLSASRCYLGYEVGSWPINVFLNMRIFTFFSLRSITFKKVRCCILSSYCTRRCAAFIIVVSSIFTIQCLVIKLPNFCINQRSTLSISSSSFCSSNVGTFEPV